MTTTGPNDTWMMPRTPLSLAIALSLLLSAFSSHAEIAGIDAASCEPCHHGPATASVQLQLLDAELRPGQQSPFEITVECGRLRLRL
jgi:hypothetical protein